MAIQQSRTVGVTADLRVHVPRDAAGDLVDGVATVVGRVESVADVESVDVTDVTPRLNDLAVEARVGVRVAVEHVEGGATERADGVAAERADGVAAERADGETGRIDGAADGHLRLDGEAVAAALDEGFGVDVADVAVE